MTERDCACPNTLHDHPLPPRYVAASNEADARLESGWRNVQCPDCHLYGWKPPARTTRQEPSDG
ncbi:hypothetical protein [Mycolicibacterium llatzerense]|uniref:hypothetical protein n=1 Tax=Mycolicibacterium llatzerense TaxID=280871 RepID=UPI0021B4FC1E|nr:hypothetical protein [Mycolicibacterium llatzerense]